MSHRRAGQSGDPLPVDPALYERDEMRAAIIRHDFATLYRALRDEQGLHQRRIAELTGQKQSEVSEILAGRQVHMYSVLRRIVTGLGIPPELAGLSAHDPAAAGTYPEQVTVVDPEEVARMLRRHLIAQGGITLTGAVVAKLGALLAQLPGPSPVPLPGRLSSVHVEQVQHLTCSVREEILARGSNLQMSSASAAWAERLLTVPATEPLTRALRSAVAEMHTLASGWAALDAGLYDRALWHYSRGLELATNAGDTYLQAIALACAGLTMLEQGNPGDGLKMLQFAQVKAWDIPAAHDRQMLDACARADSVIALASRGEVQAAIRELSQSRELWQPRRPDPRGDQDYVAARLELSRGRLDAAEPFAAASVRRWQGVSALRGAQSATVLATIHVQSGDPDSLRLARDAITAVDELSSASVRRRLLSLAGALDARPGTDARDLARQARQIATARV
jgi:transcriptional regulator with XRE-family HTH domain